MAYTLQANKKTTVSGAFAAGATSLTLATAAFTNFTDGFLVVDYDNDSKFEIIKCTVTGTAVSSITRGQDGTSNVDHSSGAKIGFMFVPSHFTQLAATAASDGWSTWSPSFTGFSANPTVTARYIQLGKTVIASVVTTVAGTSNATTFTVTLPVAAKQSTAAGLLYLTQDNGATPTTPGRIDTIAASTTANLYKDVSGAAWTNTNGKYATFTITYEAN